MYSLTLFYRNKVYDIIECWGWKFTQNVKNMPMISMVSRCHHYACQNMRAHFSSFFIRGNNLVYSKRKKQTVVILLKRSTLDKNHNFHCMDWPFQMTMPSYIWIVKILTVRRHFVQDVCLWCLSLSLMAAVI